MHLQEYQIQNWPSSMWLTGSQPLLANLIQQTLLPQLHPADYWAPEAFDQVVAIKELRQGLGSFASRSAVGSLKLAVIPMADKLRAEAANSLLKLLEEPPAYLKLLLLSESENILPTLRSRVQHFLVVESAQGIQPLLTKQELPWTDWKEWQAVLSDLDPARPIDRAQISAILYRMPLMHNQIQQELIRKAWKKS